jgi:putative restriction endonuclease
MRVGVGQLAPGQDGFANGDQYYARAGRVIALPAHRSERPGREFIEWHMDKKFLAS